MDIRVDADKTKTVKVKLQSDEMAVRVGKTVVASDKNRSSVASLRAQFEETVADLRQNRSVTLSSLPSLPKTDTLLQPTPPSLSAHHPLLQTLLKLMWETHMQHFHSVTTTFREGIQMKVKNTKAFVAFRNDLDDFASKLVDTMHTQSLNDVRHEFRSLWAENLRDAKEALASPSADVDELLQLALQNAVESTKLQPKDLEADVKTCLGSLKETYATRGTRLWDEWTMHMQRHKLVFQGNLKDLEFVDKKLAALPTLQAVSSSQWQTDEDSKPMHTISSAWTDMIVMLTTMKLDFDIRLGCVAKLKEWAIKTLQESKAKHLADAFSTLTAQESSLLETAKQTLTQALDEQKIGQDRVLRELHLACNNSLAPVDAVLKSMQLSVELALETARESIYIRALHELKSVCK